MGEISAPLTFRFASECHFQELPVNVPCVVRDVRDHLKRTLHITSPLDIVVYSYCVESDSEGFALPDTETLYGGTRCLVKRVPESLAVLILQQADARQNAPVVSDSSKLSGASTPHIPSGCNASTAERSCGAAPSSAEATSVGASPSSLNVQQAFLQSGAFFSDAPSVSRLEKTVPPWRALSAQATPNTFPSGVTTPVYSDGISASSLSTHSPASDLDPNVSTHFPDLSASYKVVTKPSSSVTSRSSSSSSLPSILNGAPSSPSSCAPPFSNSIKLTASLQPPVANDSSAVASDDTSWIFDTDEDDEEETERERLLLQKVMEQHGEHRGPREQILTSGSTGEGCQSTLMGSGVNGSALGGTGKDVRPRESLASRYYRSRNLTWVKGDSTSVANVSGSAASGQPGSSFTSYNNYPKRPGRPLFTGNHSRNLSANTIIPVREGYLCHICGEKGHHIRNCPKGHDPKQQKKVKPATGLPRSWLQRISEDQVAQLNCDVYNLPDGTFAVLKDLTTVASSAALAQPLEKKIRHRYGAASSSVIGDHLQCPICRRLFQQAMLTPCCGETFCESCVTSRLATGEPRNACPSCREIINPGDLSSNKVIQESVDAVLRALPTPTSLGSSTGTHNELLGEGTMAWGNTSSSTPPAVVHGSSSVRPVADGSSGISDGSNNAVTGSRTGCENQYGKGGLGASNYMVSNGTTRTTTTTTAASVVPVGAPAVLRHAQSTTLGGTAVSNNSTGSRSTAAAVVTNSTLQPQCLPPGTVRVVNDTTARPIPLGWRLAASYKLKRMRATTSVLPRAVTHTNNAAGLFSHVPSTTTAATSR